MAILDLKMAATVVLSLIHIHVKVQSPNVESGASNMLIITAVEGQLAANMRIGIGHKSAFSIKTLDRPTILTTKMLGQSHSSQETHLCLSWTLLRKILNLFKIEAHLLISSK